MSISSISTNPDNYQIGGVQTIFQQIQTAFQQLGQALQSGNLSNAQAAFSSVQQLLPNSSAVSQAQSGQQNSSQNNFITDLNALGQALQSGDLTKAQDAFAKLQQDTQSVHKRHHHHHQSGAAQNSLSASDADSGSGSSTTGNNLNVTT